ncbi:MAG: ATP12 family chaperone protein [Methyloligellaceae bacterium]
MSDNNGTGEIKSGPKFMSKADMEKKLMRRFYKDVGIEKTDNGFSVQLDGKSIKTPVKNPLVIPSKPLALAIADEWDAQEEHIDPANMLLTKLANTAIDRVKGREDTIILEIAGYISSDLLCYRSESPQELFQKQCEAWDPVLAMFEEKLDIRLKTIAGIIHVEQPELSINNAKGHLENFDVYELSALHNMTSMLGSAVLAIAHANNYLDLQKTWEIAHVDEDWQVAQWGSDEEAEARRAIRYKEMQITSRFLELNRSSGQMEVPSG